MNNKIDMIKFGANKGGRGTVWDEKGRIEIAKIFIYIGVDSYFVCSLQFLFVEDGKFVLSQLHGADHNFPLTTNLNTYGN